MIFKIVKTGNKLEAIVTRIQRNDGLSDGDVIIPNGITKISKNATAHLKGLKIGRVILPPSIEVVEEGTFANYPNLDVLVGSASGELVTSKRSSVFAVQPKKREDLPQNIVQGFSNDAQFGHISSKYKIFDFKIDANKFLARTQAKHAQTNASEKTK